MLAYISLPNCGAFISTLERNAAHSNVKASDGFNETQIMKQSEIGSGCFSMFFQSRFKNERGSYSSLRFSVSFQRPSPYRLCWPPRPAGDLSILRPCARGRLAKLSLSIVHPPSLSLTRPHSLHRQLAPHLPLAHRQPSGLAGPAGSYHPSLPPACRSSHR